MEFLFGGCDIVNKNDSHSFLQLDHMIRVTVGLKAILPCDVYSICKNFGTGVLLVNVICVDPSNLI
jgi:hypothetical protein